jgi:hypothetical protein
LLSVKPVDGVNWNLSVILVAGQDLQAERTARGAVPSEAEGNLRSAAAESAPDKTLQ